MGAMRLPPELPEDGRYFDFTDKVALVTGGGRGLGLEMVRAFARMGADVVIASRKLEACEQAAEEVRALGRRALPVACHVGDWADLNRLTETAYAEFGRVDVLVNNAGLGPSTPHSLDVGEDLFDKVLAVNLKGPYRLAALIGDRMRQAGSGSIINVTSTAGIKPKPETSIYAAAKIGLNALTKAQALEFGPEVRVNAIMCGPFWTDISRAWREEADRTSVSAVKRIGRPQEIVTTALYLGSSYSSFTTGAVIQLDGGLP